MVALILAFVALLVNRRNYVSGSRQFCVSFGTILSGLGHICSFMSPIFYDAVHDYLWTVFD